MLGLVQGPGCQKECPKLEQLKRIQSIKLLGVQATLAGKPGAAYVDLASDLLFAAAPSSDVSLDLPPVQSIQTREALARPSASSQDVQQAAQLLRQARR